MRVVAFHTVLTQAVLGQRRVEDCATCYATIVATVTQGGCLRKRSSFSIRAPRRQEGPLRVMRSVAPVTGGASR